MEHRRPTHRLYRVALVPAVAGLASLSVQVINASSAFADGCITEADQTICPGDPNAVTGLVYLDLPGVLDVDHVVDTATDSLTQTIRVSSLEATSSTVNPTTVAVLSAQDLGYSAGDTSVDGTTDVVPGSSGSGYTCVNNSSNKYFIIDRPIVLAHSNNVYQYRWQYNPYEQQYARIVSGKWTWQFEICTVGGADGQNGYRTLYNASIMAAENSDDSTRIGLNYGTGSSSSASASITMSASLGPVTISGSIPTTSGGALYGQYGKPKYQSWADKWSGTESFAGWKAGCTYASWCGSADMQSQVHHALFEFYHGDWHQTFPLDAQFNYYCADPYGVGCG